MRNVLTIVILAMILLGTGCSSGEISPVLPTEIERTPVSNVGHSNWGVWQFTADPEKETLEVVPLRQIDQHLNVLPFLEPPLMVNIKPESINFNGSFLEVVIRLTHPFSGINKFTGFDVAGILITNGSLTGFNDPGLRLTTEGDTRLLNPDGYIRWWNPAEFPHNGSTNGYVDGLLGVEDSVGNFNATLNAYKLFADDFALVDDPIDSLSVDSRCEFTAGTQNYRWYNIKLGNDGLVFNYAVDASWASPLGSPPWNIPDDFPPGANRPEAWNVQVTEITNTLWNDGVGSGGVLSLEMEVWDHYNPELNEVYVESPGNFTMAGPATLDNAQSNWATFSLNINDATPAEGSIDLLITVASEQSGYQGALPSIPVSLWGRHSASVSGQEPVEGPKNIELRPGVDAMDIAVDHNDGDLLVLYGDGAVWKYTESGNYNDGSQIYLTYEPGMQFIDIAPNSNSVAGGFWMNLADKMQVHADDGTLVSNVDIETGACWAHDVTGFTGPIYTNMAGLFSSTCSLGSHLRWRFYPPPDYQTGYWFANLMDSACGPTKIHRDTTVGTEAGNISSAQPYVYYLEGSASGCNEYRVQRLYRPSGTTIIVDTGWGPNSQGYWGGVQHDDMDGFWDPKDITRDADNDFYILDILSTGVPAIKKYTDNGTPIGNPFGDSTKISGAPLRIEGSDYIGPDGNLLYVLHDGGSTDLLSIFLPAEIPD